ncbi:DNA replication complex GINS sld5 [Cryptosporidium sp. chipmunk genotype I]|uniref:DNA replication complex GINS sld5 n=1 Tax=Cryptosporidium sp. chipmunk genotype I TaxID=1280935 RepID=UPI00351A6B7D|nr:DNA replication complex GINS sld5 [Cryptosporidium sp. chipmunk genotype I]
MDYIEEGNLSVEKENLRVNLIDGNDLEYIDNIYSSKNFGLSDDSHIKNLKKSQENLLTSWINELVSPELLTYCESSIQTLSYSIFKEKEKQRIMEGDRGILGIEDKIEQDLINLHINRSTNMLKMYLKQRIMKISEFPDFSIANSRTKSGPDSESNISHEEAAFALKLSKLQWKYLDETISKMKNTLATDSSVPIPAPSLHRSVRFKCTDSIGRVQLQSLATHENTSFTQFEDQSHFSQNDSEGVINIEKGKIYTCKYEDVRTLLDQNTIQLWPWPPITSNKNNSC